MGAGVAADAQVALDQHPEPGVVAGVVHPLTVEDLVADDAVSKSDLDQLGARVRAASAGLAAAQARGLRTADGLGMLLHQAVRGFELWFGRRPDVTPDLRALIEADLRGHVTTT